MSKPTYPLAVTLRERADQDTEVFLSDYDRRLMREAAESLDNLYHRAYLFIPKPRWWPFR